MFGRALIGLALSTTMFVGDVAVARDWDRYPDRRYDRRRDRIDAGDVLLGVGIIAGIAVLASEIGKNRRERDEPIRRDQNWPFDRGDGTGRDRTSDARDYGRDAAVDACSAEAEREGEKYSSRVRVDQIEDVRRERDNRYEVRGVVDIDRAGGSARERDDRRWADAQRARFTCIADGGRVVSFRLGSSAELANRY
jgi:hypothetical protein